MIPDSAFTSLRFYVVAGPAHGWLLSECGREYLLPRGTGGRLTISGEVIVSPTGSVSLGIGFPTGIGDPFSALLDTGAECAVFSPADVHALAHRSGHPGRPVCGVGGLVHSVDPGTLVVEFCADVKMTRIWQQLSVAPAGSATLDRSSFLAGGVATLRPCRGPRKSVGTMLRSASDVSARLLVWNSDRLRRMPASVSGSSYSPARVRRSAHWPHGRLHGRQGRRGRRSQRACISRGQMGGSSLRHDSPRPS